MAELDLLFLGQSRVELNGKPVLIPRRKALALLACIAVAPSPRGRDQLAEILYPGRDRDRAYGDMRLCLYHLRKAIGERWIDAGSTFVVLKEQKGLRVDVTEFWRLARSGTRESLAAAARLYRGEFLAGFSLKDAPDFELWQAAEAERLRRGYAGAVERLAALCRRAGDTGGAVAWARQAVDLDPMAQPTLRTLLRALRDAGRRDEALRHYERFRASLAESPEEETEQLAREIAAGGTATAGADGSQPPSRGPHLLLARLRSGTLARSTFATPEDALGAAVQMASDWASVVLLEDGPEGRRGESIARAARPGQVLLGESFALLARDVLPPGAKLLPFGPRTPDDLGAPLLLHGLQHPELPSPLPPPRTVDACPGNLRGMASAFVGRTAEIDAIMAVFLRGNARLVTLTGPGGTGKTRLALHAAARLAPSFAHGVYLVDLAAVSDPDEVVAAIGAAVSLRQVAGDSRPLDEVLAGFIGSKEMLLILDNFEHLMPAAPGIARLSAACPGLKVMATSREALHLRDEQEYPVPPLDSSSPDAAPAPPEKRDAVQLFLARARAVDPDFPCRPPTISAIAEVCEALDRLPLAIELAAAWVKVLPPEALLERLARRLDLLTRGAGDLPRRQRSLRSEIAWSYELLDSGDQLLFRRLAVFSGGCSVCGAESVCGEGGTIQGLASLVDKSLLRGLQRDGVPRFRMLETIREFAWERLQAHGEAADMQRRFARWATGLPEAECGSLYGPAQARAFAVLDAESDNLQHALAWLLDCRAAADGVRVAGALGWFWFRRGRFTVGARWLREFLALADGTADPASRARALYHLGWMHLMLDSTFSGSEGARRCFRESLELWEKAGDRRGTALSMAWLAWCEIDREMTDRCAMADRSVATARASGDPWALSFCLKLAWSYLPRADRSPRERISALEESIGLARETGDPFLVCQALHGMGDVYMHMKDDRSAEPWYTESLEAAEAAGDSWSAFDARSHLAWGLYNRGDPARARGCFEEGLRSAIEAGARSYYGQFIHGLALLAREEGAMVRALRLGGVASALRYYGDAGADPRLTEATGCPPEIVKREWSRGRTMSIEEAVRYALAGEG